MPRATANQRNQLQLAADRLDFAQKLQILSNKIHTTDNITQIMLDLAPDICALFQCDRLTLYVVNKEKAVLVSRIKLGILSDKDLVLPINKSSVAGFVALSRQTVRIDNLYDAAQLLQIDPELRFCDKVDQITGYESRQMLAAPLISGTDQHVVGVIQLINQTAGAHFSPVAEDGLSQLATTLALAIEKRLKTAALLPKRYEVLVRFGALTAQELELAQRWAQRKNLELEQVLVQDFQVPLATLGQAFAKGWDVPYQPFQAGRKPDPELLSKIKRAVCQKHHWLPWEKERTVLVVVSTDPEDRFSADNIKQAFPFSSVVYRATTCTEFEQMLAQYFPAA